MNPPSSHYITVVRDLLKEGPLSMNLVNVKVHIQIQEAYAINAVYIDRLLQTDLYLSGKEN